MNYTFQYTKGKQDKQHTQNTKADTRCIIKYPAKAETWQEQKFEIYT